MVRAPMDGMNWDFNYVLNEPCNYDLRADNGGLL